MSKLYERYDDFIKTQPEDRSLREIVSNKFSRSTADYIVEKQRFDLVGGDFFSYAEKVKEILSQSDSKKDFIKQIQLLNFDLNIAIL